MCVSLTMLVVQGQELPGYTVVCLNCDIGKVSGHGRAERVCNWRKPWTAPGDPAKNTASALPHPSPFEGARYRSTDRSGAITSHLTSQLVLVAARWADS